MSRPKTVMNHGIPAAGSRPVRPLPRIRSEARSATDWKNASSSWSQSARICGTRSCQAASDSRTRVCSSPKRRSTVRGAISVAVDRGEDAKPQLPLLARP